MSTAAAPLHETAVLHVGGLLYASEKSVVEHVLGGRPGVVGVEANPVAQTATVVFDPSETSVADLQGWVEECGFHCAGSRCPGTSATRWPRAPQPIRRWRMTTRPWSAPMR